MDKLQSAPGRTSSFINIHFQFTGVPNGSRWPSQSSAVQTGRPLRLPTIFHRLHPARVIVQSALGHGLNCVSASPLRGCAPKQGSAGRARAVAIRANPWLYEAGRELKARHKTSIPCGAAANWSVQ